MLKITPIFLFGEHPRFIEGTKHVVITKKRELKAKAEEILDGLKEKLTVDVDFLKPKIVMVEKDFNDFEKWSEGTDAFLIFRYTLRFGLWLKKISEFELPIVLFHAENIPNKALDSLEYMIDKKNVFLTVNSKEIDSTLKILNTLKSLENTKILISNVDYPFYIERIRGRYASPKLIKEKLGVTVEELHHEELLRKWENISYKKAEALAKEWTKKAEKVVEPSLKDVTIVARFYLAVKALLKERKAHAFTMAYGEDSYPVPCLAYTKLRDEGIPAACEGDINSLLMMLIFHYLAEKPAFMGNTVRVDYRKNLVAFSHCVVPTKMNGYSDKPAPYNLRDYHEMKFPGSVTAYAPMKPNRIVTIARFKGDLTKMIVCNGKVRKSEETTHCRATIWIKVKDARKFLHETFGNHHVIVYGDYRKELEQIGKLLDIEVITL